MIPNVSPERRYTSLFTCSLFSIFGVLRFIYRMFYLSCNKNSFKPIMKVLISMFIGAELSGHVAHGLYLD